MGEVITFYSYRGGVGRTTALAHTATLLAEWGYKTLIIDWDLEAPGLEGYFKNYIDSKKVAQQSGLIDLLYAFGRDPSYPSSGIDEGMDEQAQQNENGTAKRNGNGRAKPLTDWRDIRVKVNFAEGQGSLDLLTAGRRDSQYFERVHSFDIQKFYLKGGGYIIEDWREQWKETYDFVLIDCRAGVTELGAICTVQLPDILFLLLTNAQDGIDNSVAVARKVTEARSRLPLDRFRLLTIPIINRVDDENVNVQVKREWLKEVELKVSDFYDDWLPTDFLKSDMLTLTKIPYYKPRLMDEQESGIYRQSSIAYAFENISALIANGLDDLYELKSNRVAYVRKANKSWTSGWTPFSPQETRRQHELWISSDGKEGAQGDFSRKKLQGIDFSKANLQQALFVGADLSRAMLSDIKLNGADLTRALLSDATLNGADLTRALMSEANLHNVKGFKAKLINTDLKKADLSNSHFVQADFYQASLQESKLIEANLSGAQFIEANLSKANFKDAQMLNANLSNSTITDPINWRLPQFGGANLSGAKLSKDISENISEGEELSSARRYAIRFQLYFFGLLAASCYVLLMTLRASTDALLLVNRHLPGAGGQIPARTFIFVAPSLLLALYLLLYRSLFKLQSRVAALPETFPSRRTSGEEVTNAYMRAALQLPGKLQPQRRHRLMIFLARCFVPATLFLIWARYLPLRDWVGTSLHVLLLVASILATIHFSRWRAKLTGKTPQP